MKMGVRLLIAAAMVMANALPVLAAPQNATKKTASKKPAAPPPTDCGHGVSLRLTSLSAVQGSLLEATLRSAAPLAGIKADWAGHDLPFWQDAKLNALHHALIGVDLERPPGQYDLKLTAQLPGGDEVACSVIIPVKAGKFPVEKLTVANEYVEPNKEEAERGEQEHERLAKILATVTPDRLWQGSFRLPLDGARNAKNFGRSRVLNGQPRAPHSGVDFPAPSGTPIHATQRGRVVLAENLFFSGNTVVIDHGLGVYTYYGHMESIAVSVGDEVEKSSILGKVGATGRVTGPHLHWGLTVNQARVNPLQILPLPMS